MIRNGPTSAIKEVERFAMGRHLSYMVCAETGLREMWTRLFCRRTRGSLRSNEETS